MILTLIAIIFLGVISYLSVTHERSTSLMGTMGTLGLVLSTSATCMYMLGVLLYVSAGYKTDIINREFNTNYTRIEVFYAGDIINTIQEIKRTRIEIPK